MLERKPVVYIPTGEVSNILVEERGTGDEYRAFAYLHINKDGTPSRRSGHRALHLTGKWGGYTLLDDSSVHKHVGNSLRARYKRAQAAADEAKKALYGHYGKTPR